MPVDDSFYVPIADGTLVRIDASDAPLLANGSWKYRPSRGVYLRKRINGKRYIVILHRVIVGATDPNDRCCHRNGDKRDNRRSNLQPSRFGCPFTAESLGKMYRKRGGTLKHIAAVASRVTDMPPVTRKTVREWLKKAGIRLRTPSEASLHTICQARVRSKMAAGLQARWERVRAGQLPMPSPNAAPMPRAVTRAGQVAARIKRRGEREIYWPIVQCDGCGKGFRRRACVLRAAENHAENHADGKRVRRYCSRTCACVSRNFETRS